MVRVYYSDYFIKRVGKINGKQQAKLSKLLVYLKENPFHPQLHTKTLSGRLSGSYSFRISRSLRVVFRFLSVNEILLIDVGDRKDIYK